LPPCQTLRTAAKFFSRLAHYENPAEIRHILGSCAPDLLALGVSPGRIESALLPGGPVFLSW
jgi:hypothetical protein